MKTRISGWGRYPFTHSTKIIPATGGDIEKATKNNPTLLARGLGRSYGDSANADTHLDMRGLNNFLDFDVENGTLQAQAGVSLKEILDIIVPKGWFLYTTPGTQFVTIGGAISSDVHGKNHHHDGAFSECVLSMDIILADGERKTITPNDTEFQYICGGMGLVGIIISAKIKLRPVKSAYIQESTYKAKNIDTLITLMETHEKATYSVAWIDCLQKGKALGRGLLMVGEHATDNDLNLPTVKTKTVPFNFPSFALNSLTVRIFNMLYFNKVWRKISHNKVRYDTFFYPLDAVYEWNKIYGKKGFTQYQCVVPKQNGAEAIKELLTEISNAGLGSFLSVLKLLGKQNNNALSFPMEGYTLALDFKIEPKLFPLLDTLDAIVQKYGGRLYLTKDVRMSADFMQKTYGKSLENFVQYRNTTTLEKFNSHQSERLKI